MCRVHAFDAVYRLNDIANVMNSNDELYQPVFFSVFTLYLSHMPSHSWHKITLNYHSIYDPKRKKPDSKRILGAEKKNPTKFHFGFRFIYQTTSLYKLTLCSDNFAYT